MINARHLLIPLLVVGLTTSARAKEEDEEAAAAEEETRTKASEQAAPRTLAERIPSVTRRAFRKAGRVELAPALGLALNDPFYDSYVLGAGATYHLGEALAVAGSADFFLASENAIAVSGGRQPTRPDYDRAAFTGRVELVWTPLYGKVSLLAETVLHFDTYLSFGPGVVGPSEGDPGVLGTAALGQHYFLSEWMALRLELRDQVFMLARNPAASSDEQLNNLLTFTVGLSFFLPTEVAPESL